MMTFATNLFKARLLKFFNARGFQVVRTSIGFSHEEIDILTKIAPYTGTSVDRQVGVIAAVKYLVSNQIQGDFVECGVWRGGSMMAAMYSLLNLKDTARNMYLFDTFEGMSAPTDQDVMFDGQKAQDILDATKKAEGAGNYWCIAGIDDVRQNVALTKYPKDKIHLVQGKVEETIPKQAPEKIALLRLDTDWYESTAHELEHLYPRLVENGILIIDDYGHWQGARKAVDEYFAKQKFRPLMTRLDYTGRMLTKRS